MKHDDQNNKRRSRSINNNDCGTQAEQSLSLNKQQKDITSHPDQKQREFINKHWLQVFHQQIQNNSNIINLGMGNDKALQQICEELSTKKQTESPNDKDPNFPNFQSQQKQVSENLLDFVEEIDLTNQEIGDDGLKVLIEMLKKNKNIKYLAIRGNKISEIGAKYLFELLDSESELKEIDISENFVPLDLEEEICHFIENLKYLRVEEIQKKEEIAVLKQRIAENEENSKKVNSVKQDQDNTTTTARTIAKRSNVHVQKEEKGIFHNIVGLFSSIFDSKPESVSEGDFW